MDNAVMTQAQGGCWPESDMDNTQRQYAQAGGTEGKQQAQKNRLKGRFG